MTRTDREALYAARINFNKTFGRDGELVAEVAKEHGIPVISRHSSIDKFATFSYQPTFLEHLEEINALALAKRIRAICEDYRQVKKVGEQQSGEDRYKNLVVTTAGGVALAPLMQSAMVSFLSKVASISGAEVWGSVHTHICGGVASFDGGKARMSNSDDEEKIMISHGRETLQQVDKKIGGSRTHLIIAKIDADDQVRSIDEVPLYKHYIFGHKFGK